MLRFEAVFVLGFAFRGASPLRVLVLATFEPSPERLTGWVREFVRADPFARFESEFRP